MALGSSATGLIEHGDGAQWSSVGGAKSADLRAVAAISSRDVWAAGDILEHYDGSAWRAVSTNLSNNEPGEEVIGLAAVASNDVWAVGNGGNTSDNGQLVMHYDGRGWTALPARLLPVSRYVNLYAVAGRSSNDLWAVGRAYSQNAQSANSTVVEHRDGATWRTASTPPDPGSINNQLDGIAAFAGGDAWAAGSYGANQVSQALLLHYLA